MEDGGRMWTQISQVRPAEPGKGTGEGYRAGIGPRLNQRWRLNSARVAAYLAPITPGEDAKWRSTKSERSAAATPT